MSVALLARSRPIHGMYCLNNYCWDFSPSFVILTAFYSSKTYKTCKISTCFASRETWHFVNNFCHHRCKCLHCSTEAVTKAEECICCKEIDRVGGGNEPSWFRGSMHNAPSWLSWCLSESMGSGNSIIGPENKSWKKLQDPFQSRHQEWIGVSCLL